MSVESIGNDPQPGNRMSSTVPGRVPLTPVTIWPLDLQIDDSKAARWFAGLTSDEQARSNRFVHREHQRRFIAGRSQLRQILGLLSGKPADELRFHYGAYGKPDILGTHSLHFSMAHSDGVGVVATCAVAPVGVDLEIMSPHEEVAERVLSENELRVLRACSGDRAELFLKYWTGKEAFLKLWGIGLSLEPKTIEIDWNGCPICRSLDTQETRVKNAWLELTSACPETICALACELPPICSIRRLELS
jgi:4'-phosphopantetheinyl transferase